MLTETAATVEKSEAAQTAHVLAVDDDPSVRKMIVDYLGDNEVKVTALASGRDIAEVMARETIDLLVLDLRLPGEDGMQIARKLREVVEREQHRVLVALAAELLRRRALRGRSSRLARAE